ncbi:unnamed protein product, partial [Mesorhabditis spiculigera]
MTGLANFRRSSFSARPLKTDNKVAPTRKNGLNAMSENDQWPLFRHYFSTGALPVKIDHNSVGPPTKLKWTYTQRELSEEMLRMLLPKFALGLPLLDQPYRFVAERGFGDLLDACKSSRPVIASLPQIVRAIRAALYSFDNHKKREMLKALIKLSMIQGVGPALVPFYRQLLPPLRVVNHISAADRNKISIDRDLERDIEVTLNELEKSGGPNAYINIKYVLPMYESCRGI